MSATMLVFTGVMGTNWKTSGTLPKGSHGEVVGRFRQTILDA